MPNVTVSENRHRKPEHKAPDLPWPLSARIYNLEITRWRYKASTLRNAGDWVYLVHVEVDELSARSANVFLCFRVIRIREDYATKRRYDLSRLNMSLALEVNRRLKRPPEKFLADFQSFGRGVWVRAQRHQKLYKKAVRRWYALRCCRACYENVTAILLTVRSVA